MHCHNSCVIAPNIFLLTGYSIFVVIGTLPPCEADQVLSLVRVEAPPLSPTNHQHSAHPEHSRGDSGEQPHASSSKRHSADKPSGYGRFFKLRHFSAVKGEGVGREEQDLQMAMAMSASLEQEQEQFEIDQQLRIQQLQEVKGDNPALHDDNEASSDYGEEEEDAAITAAIYASLGRPTERVANLRQKRVLLLVRYPDFRDCNVHSALGTAEHVEVSRCSVCSDCRGSTVHSLTH